jgi:GxxExxY protein
MAAQVLPAFDLVDRKGPRIPPVCFLLLRSGMTTIAVDEVLTERVIGCAIEVHRTLGPGLLESVYRDCLHVELRAAGLSVQSGARVALTYKGQIIGNDLKLDLLVESRLVVELKAVECLHPIHLAQVITYLKLSGYPLGLLMNFNATTLKAGLRRLDHPDRYVKKK